MNARDKNLVRINRSIDPKKLKVLSAALAAGICGFALLYIILSNFFIYNRTASLPTGLYLKLNSKDIALGDTVIFCPPYNQAMKYAENNNFWRGLNYNCGNTPMYMKKVMGTSGDKIKVGYSGTYVNNDMIRDSTPVKKLINSGFFDNYEKEYVLTDGEFFLMSDYNSNSFDSRYFGIIHQSQIKGKVFPIWTFN